MNMNFLLQYISQHFHTFVRQYDWQGRELFSYCARLDFHDLCTRLSEIQSELLRAANSDYPVITCIDGQVMYAVISSPDFIFLIGPVRFSSYLPLQHYMNNIELDSNWIQSVPVCGLRDVLQDALILHNLFRDDILNISDAMYHLFPENQIDRSVQKQFSDDIFNNQEYGNKHNPYDQEVREINSIRTGNIEQLKKSWEEDYDGTVGVLAPTVLRSSRNIGIVLITLASRAAIEGGVHPEIAYTLADSYTNRIEKAEYAEAAVNLGRQAEMQYAMLVNDIRKRRQNTPDKIEISPAVEKCKDYVFYHLHEKIVISDIAKKLHIHPNYLSGIFRQYEGITLSEFIIQEKVGLAKNLLIYSNYSYIEIATYLGFSSQSHLGKYFKRYTGYTMLKYRKLFGRKEFL